MSLFLLLALALVPDPEPTDPWVVFQGITGPGKDRHIVFVTGDEEYRSEEGMPQLARILALHHGFRCTVLFPIDPESGEIDPDVNDNIPGLSALADADLMVLFTRFRDLPDEQMKYIVDYVESGRPIIGLRTATHAFRIQKHTTYKHYDWHSKEWDGGFGRQVLGETWVAHHGAHGSESSRGIPAEGQADHPILRGIAPKGIWDPSDVYTVRLPLPEGCEPIVMGQVLAGMSPDDPPLPSPEEEGARDKNDPMMPMAWTNTYTTRTGEQARVFSTTMGSAQAFTAQGSRRLLVNACYWALEMEDQIKADSNVDLVGKYEPSRFGFGKARKGVKPSHLRP